MATTDNYLPSYIARPAQGAPFLEREEEKQLAIAWREHGDRVALTKLTTAHMRLVIAMAQKFRQYGLPLGDMVQEGHVGLLEAAARFQPEREFRFATYATWWIRASMQDYILRNWSIVRGGTSSSQKALFFNLRRLRARIERDHNHDGKDVDGMIASAIGVSRADVARMSARFAGSDVPLDVTMSDEDGSATRKDFLADEGPLPDEIVEETIDSDRRKCWLKDALSVLSERELRIVRERIMGDEVVTLEVLSDKFGISRERVRQVQNRALLKLRRALKGMEAAPQGQDA